MSSERNASLTKWARLVRGAWRPTIPRRDSSGNPGRVSFHRVLYVIKEYRRCLRPRDISGVSPDVCLSGCRFGRAPDVTRDSTIYEACLGHFIMFSDIPTVSHTTKHEKAKTQFSYRFAITVWIERNIESGKRDMFYRPRIQ